MSANGDGRRPLRDNLAEDEAPVRELASQMLKSAGYTVLQAPGDEKALRLSEEYPGQSICCWPM
jgi:hypothetical protein